MKKLTAILLACMMLCLLFAGCAPAADTNSTDASDTVQDTAADPTAAPAADTNSTDTSDTVQDTAADATAAPAADDDLAYIKGNGKMVIGITIYEPMNYYDDANNLVGFDTEYAEAVCEKLGVTAEFQVINWDTKEIELKSKTIDAIWNGLTINDERRENMDFTNPYIKNMQVCVIKADNADKYTDTASMKEAKLVAEISSAGEGAIAADENLKLGEYTAMPTQADALFEVKSGTAQVAVIDYVMAKAMVGEGTDYADLMIVEGVELSVEEYGIGLRLGSNVTKAINDATDELIADGTLNTLAEKYGLADSLVANQ